TADRAAPRRRAPPRARRPRLDGSVLQEPAPGFLGNGEAHLEPRYLGHRRLARVRIRCRGVAGPGVDHGLLQGDLLGSEPASAMMRNPIASPGSTKASPGRSGRGLPAPSRPESLPSAPAF